MRFDEFKTYVPPPTLQYATENVASSQHALYIPDIILTTLPVQFQPFQKPELPYKGHAQDNIIGDQSVHRTPGGVQGGHKDLLKICTRTETDATAPKGLKGVGETKLDQRRRLKRQAEAIQQGMREFPLRLQTGHKIGDL